MRGNDTVRGSLFGSVDLETRIGADHPLWVIRGIVDVPQAATKSLRPKDGSGPRPGPRRAPCRSASD
jgi:hypothetical protein